MSTTAIDIVNVNRVAAALGVTVSRIIKAVGELGLIEHRINGQAFIDAADEDKLRRHLEGSKS